MPKYYVGIDLGTSAVKILLVSRTGEIAATVSKSYAVDYPHPGWSEQNPQVWWDAVVDGVRELVEGVDPAEIKGIACGGQMHGLVVLDSAGDVIRPCILWNDGRTQEQADYLNAKIGRDRLVELTGNIAFAGFTAPKLLWMREHEPELFARIAHIMLPKDYLVYRMTGEFVTDYTDASGTLLLDVQHRGWSSEMVDICGVERTWLPTLLDSAEKAGVLQSEAAAELGIMAGTTVAAGAGDNAAAAIGCGAVNAGACNISLGTSGTVFIPSSSHAVDPSATLHAFDYIEGRFNLMGCVLSAASCTGWFVGDVLRSDDIDAEEAGIDPSLADGDLPYFLPYLMGERSPHNDANARASFVGMRADSKRSDLVRAVREGVAFAMRDCIEASRALGTDVRRATLCGGGARSALMRQMLANVLGVQLDLPTTEQGPGYGAAMLAMVANGDAPDIDECSRGIVSIRETVSPDANAVAAYERRYRTWRRLYPALKPVFDQMAG